MSATREKIIALADGLVRTKGFNAFSYKDLSEPLEIKNAAVHYHFPAKADLGIGVIDQEIDQFMVQTARWRDLPEDKQLVKLFEVFGNHCKKGNICLMGSLAPDYETLPAPMQEKVQTMGNNILEWLRDCLMKGRKHKHFHFDGAPYDRALLIITNLQSSLILSRVLGTQVFDRISKQLMQDLKP